MHSINLSSINRSKFQDKVLQARHEPLTALDISVLQVNMGYRCNMACAHCHVSAGPARTEMMDRNTVDAVVAVLLSQPVKVLDITGGAPELNPHFRMLVVQARRAGKRVLVRTNLTILSEPGMRDLPEFFQEQEVDLIASLPCYLEDNVSTVRGSGAYQKSISALRKLNALGFGKSSDGPSLSLVYNPLGAFLPPEQHALEADYKRELKNRHDIHFTRLYAFTNMAIGRFRDALVRNGTFKAYQNLLANAFNPHTLDKVMCRSLVSVGWDGSLFDCDFNQVLGLAMSSGAPHHIKDFDYQSLLHRAITVDDHCYACTAGQGST